MQKTIKQRIKDNLFLFIYGVICIIFAFTLITLGVFIERHVIYYEAVKKKDVSSNFSSTLPILRYLIEPFYFVPLVLQNSFDYLLGAIIIIIIIRALYTLLDKKCLIKSEKIKLIKLMILDYLRFSFIVMSITLLTIIIILLIELIFFGFFLVAFHFMGFIQFGTTVAFIILITKAIYMAVVYAHPQINFHYRGKFETPQNGGKIKKIAFHLKKESIIIFGLLLLLLEAHVILLSFHFPTQQVETDLEEGEFLLDFHVHTTFSDGWVSPQERVDWYIEQGIIAAAFSDHDNIHGYLSAKEYVESNDLDFTPFLAQEWTNNEKNIHMNIFGLEESVVPPFSESELGPKAMNAEEVIKYVKQKGAYITVNHYNAHENEDGDLGIPYTLKELKDWGVDGFEIVNDGNLYPEKIREFCLNESLICMGGSDIHTNQEINTFVKIDLNSSKNLNLDAIFSALRKNQHEVIAIDYYPEKLKVPDQVDDYLPMQKIVNYFLNLDDFQIISWISWTFLSFGFFIIIYKSIKKRDLQKLRKKFLEK